MKKKRPQEKFMSTVKVGPKGQVVIPKEVRDMFGIEPGDQLLLLADKRRGIALERYGVFSRIADAIFEGKGKKIYPEEPEKNLEAFANAIKEAGEAPEEEES